MSIGYNIFEKINWYRSPQYILERCENKPRQHYILVAVVQVRGNEFYANVASKIVERNLSEIICYVSS